MPITYKMLKKEKKEEKKQKFPLFRCPHCNNLIQLDYDITGRFTRKKWERFECPNCGKNNVSR